MSIVTCPLTNEVAWGEEVKNDGSLSFEAPGGTLAQHRPHSAVMQVATSQASPCVNNPETEALAEDAGGLVDSQMFSTSTGEGLDQHAMMDLRPNFSQVIAEAVQEIITRYKEEEGRDEGV